MSRSDPSLVDREAAGGAHAIAGFDYQDLFAAAKIAMWLRRDGFSELLSEGAGDVEIKSFVPAVGFARDLHECKNHTVTPAEFFEELDRFARLDEQEPAAFSSFTLVCPNFSALLGPLRNALTKIQKAGGFYGADSALGATSIRQVETVIEGFGRDKSLAKLLLQKVALLEYPDYDQTRSFNDFRPEIETAYPALRGLDTAKLRAVHNALLALLAEYRSRTLARSEIEHTIATSAGVEVTAGRVRLLTSDDPVITAATSNQIVFHWAEFSGDTSSGKRVYPGGDRWNKGVVNELVQTREWISTADRPRNIILEGRRRLSAGVAIGAVFSATQGFDIEMHSDGVTTCTAEHSDVSYRWTTSSTATHGAHDELAVAIGIKQTPAEEVRRFLKGRMPILEITSTEALISGKDLNAAVWGAKKFIQDETSRFGCRVIHLFLASPIEFAVFLGHRLNACGAIQCYERSAPNEYVPTCTLNLP